MTIDEFKEILLGNSHGGLFVYYYEIESSEDRRFLYLRDCDVATLYLNSKVVERKFANLELLEFLDSTSFWSLNDFEYDQVFDGSEYQIMFKNREGKSKFLRLINPEYSESESLQKLIALIENEIFK